MNDWFYLLKFKEDPIGVTHCKTEEWMTPGFRLVYKNIKIDGDGSSENPWVFDGMSVPSQKGFGFHPITKVEFETYQVLHGIEYLHAEPFDIQVEDGGHMKIIFDIEVEEDEFVEMRTVGGKCYYARK